MLYHFTARVAWVLRIAVPIVLILGVFSAATGAFDGPAPETDEIPAESRALEELRRITGATCFVRRSGSYDPDQVVSRVLLQGVQEVGWTDDDSLTWVGPVEDAARELGGQIFVDHEPHLVWIVSEATEPAQAMELRQIADLQGMEIWIQFNGVTAAPDSTCASPSPAI